MAEPLQLLSIKAIKHQINSKSMKRGAAADDKLGVMKFSSESVVVVAVVA
jgi:hypothetical protein